MTTILNDDGFVVFSSFQNLQATAVYIEDKIIYDLPLNMWKEYEMENDCIVKYEDSEGNKWDLSYGTDFPYKHETLEIELLEIAFGYYTEQLDKAKIIINDIRKIKLDMPIKYRFDMAYNEIIDKYSKFITTISHKLKKIEEELPF